MKQENKVVVTLLISVFLLLSTFTSLYVASEVTGTFGYVQVGQNTDLLIPGYKDSCRYQASASGTINSISMYIQTANAQVRFGVYSDQNGKPSQLLAQSNQVTTVANQWAVASLTASIVAGQYYWLTVTSNAPIRYYIDYASGGSSGYAIEPTTTMSPNYGTFTAYTAVKYSMYATYTATASGPTPSPTVSPAPTPNPTVVPTVSPAPTPNPTVVPTVSPAPTPNPTVVPTVSPAPTPNPTVVPTVSPAPTPNPTVVPTVSPAPTPNPTVVPTVSPAPTPNTFGYVQVGQNTDLLIPGYKDSCRYQASASGTINSISMYIQTANAQVRFGVYSDQNGKPSQLLAQSNQVTTVANQWAVASLTASIVAGQYYWLTVTSNAPVRYYYTFVSGGSSGYAIEPTTTMSPNYGTFTAHTAVKYSIYATYISLTSEPSPVPQPTVTPMPTPSPTATPTQPPNPGAIAKNSVNGIWTLPSQPTSATSKMLTEMKITNIYVQIGRWNPDGSISLAGSPSDYRTTVANAHAVGLKVYAWVIDDGGNVALGTAAQRATAINSLVHLVQTYGFDGVADDIEIWHSYPNLIAYYNDATTALHAIGKEFFATIISYWLTDMSAAQIASIHVDRIQPMLYCLWGNIETTFKLTVDRTLTYATSPVGLAIQSMGPPSYEPMSDAMAWVDEQLFSSSTANLAGIDIFWYSSVSSSEWTAWNNWSTKG